MPNLAQQPYAPHTDDERGLTTQEIKDLWFETPMWQTTAEAGEQHLRRTFEVDSFCDALSLAAQMGALVENPDHAPIITIQKNAVTLDWWTPALNGLHTSDFVMAARTDQLYLNWLDEIRKKDPVNEASRESFPASDSPGWIGAAEKELHEV